MNPLKFLLGIVGMLVVVFIIVLAAIIFIPLAIIFSVLFILLWIILALTGRRKKKAGLPRVKVIK